MATSSAANHISTAPSMTRFVTSSTVSPSGDVKPDASHVLFVSLPVEPFGGRSMNVVRLVIGQRAARNN